MREIRLFVPAMVLGAGCLLLFGIQRQHPVRLDRPLASMPLALAGYSGIERQVSEGEQQVAGMTDYVYRLFHRDSVLAFTLYVGYYESQTTGRTIHSPKNCLPGAGWQALESSAVTITAGGKPVTVNRYMLANGPSQALVYYWYQGRGRVAHSEYRVKWDLLRDAMRHGRTEEALVRIVVPIPPGRGSSASSWNERVGRAEAVAKEVAADLIPRVNGALPTWARGAPRA
jgi:EpsI family protein